MFQKDWIEEEDKTTKTGSGSESERIKGDSKLCLLQRTSKNT